MNSKSRNKHAHTDTQTLPSFSLVPELSSVYFVHSVYIMSPFSRALSAVSNDDEPSLRTLGILRHRLALLRANYFRKISFVFPIAIYKSKPKWAAARRSVRETKAHCSKKRLGRIWWVLGSAVMAHLNSMKCSEGHEDMLKIWRRKVDGTINCVIENNNNNNNWPHRSSTRSKRRKRVTRCTNQMLVNAHTHTFFVSLFIFFFRTIWTQHYQQ